MELFIYLVLAFKPHGVKCNIMMIFFIRYEVDDIDEEGKE